MGVLYIVATPIGNLKDITLHTLDILREVDLILCEDTRITIKLLNHYGISKKLISCHSYNEKKILDRIINLIKSENKNIALVTDSGTPTISDPGHIIVEACYREGIEVYSLPGPSAFVCALSLSGFSTDTFCFLGFLPKKEGKKKKVLLNYKNFDGLIIIYESPFRMIETIQNIEDIFGEDCLIFIAKELTKMFEKKFRGKIKEIKENIKKEQLKGEFVIIINNYKTKIKKIEKEEFNK